MAGLRSFDAFPKTDETHVRKSSKGGISSLVTYLFLLFIAWTEFGSFFGGYIDEHYEVDDQMRETFQINMDMYIKTPCKFLDVNIRDKTMDRKLVSKELNLEDMPFFIPYGTSVVNEMKEIVTPDLDSVLGNAIPAQFRQKMDAKDMFEEEEGVNFNGCHVFGSILANRVAGELQITAKGYGYADFIRTPPEEMDFAHVINEFSYGEFYPYINNPLDGTAKFNIEQPRTSYVYDTAVVPTIYEKLGAKVDTNQYAVSEYHYNAEMQQMKGPVRFPGIFLRYDFEPLSIHINDVRLSFLQFVVRLVAILSFVVYTASWAFRLLDLALLTCFGPRWSLRYQSDSKSQGILDKDPFTK
ncbi:ERV41 (YML067C) [Zygosaccharomyces parabailii]|nr:ERV41 (YML067C) [Zygosaccharomyces parabailii]